MADILKKLQIFFEDEETVFDKEDKKEKKELEPWQEEQLKIAREIVHMDPSMARAIGGGMTYEEAVEIINKYSKRSKAKKDDTQPEGIPDVQPDAKISEKIELFLLDDPMLTEIKFRKVIRKGKIVKKAFCPDGFKAVGKKCVKMKPGEKLRRARSTRKAQMKIQKSGKKAKLLKSRAKSMRKRKAAIPMEQPAVK